MKEPTKMNNEYNADHSIDLNLTEEDTCSLSVVLKDFLSEHGIEMQHEEILKGRIPPATSHLGVLIRLYQRIDSARFGRKTWNHPRS
jgi:hypothetical protein